MSNLRLQNLTSLQRMKERPKEKEGKKRLKTGSDPFSANRYIPS